jgi:tRNA pseudouridine55 synthase
MSARAPATSRLNGLVVVDKETGWTSHDVVARLRGVLGERRMGHAGTLDPDATGVLLVGVGRFTRMLRFLSAATKSYEAEVVLGVATSTLDASGEVVEKWDMSSVTPEDVVQAASSLTGTIEQIPPMVSALKVRGRRLHQIARSGMEIERAPRLVTVDRFDVRRPEITDGAVYRIEVDCSTGTYVRSLAADLGRALGGGAHLRNLRRTRVGSFHVEDASRIGRVGVQSVMKPALALRDLEQVQVNPEVSRLVANGLPLDKVALGAPGEGPWVLVDPHDRVLAVYEGTDTDRMVASCVIGSDGAT